MYCLYEDKAGPKVLISRHETYEDAHASMEERALVYSHNGLNVWFTGDGESVWVYSETEDFTISIKESTSDQNFDGSEFQVSSKIKMLELA